MQEAVFYKIFHILNVTFLNFVVCRLETAQAVEEIIINSKQIMKKTFNSSAAFGIKKFGFINNFSSSVAQFNYLLQGTGLTVTSTEIDTLVDGITPVHLNSYGCDNFHGQPVGDKYAMYRVIKTGRKTAAREEIVALFVKNRKFGSFEGVTWTTMRSLRHELDLMSKPRIGEIYFANKDSFEKFLDDIASNAVAEPWSFSNRPSACKYPILKSYLENIFGKLRRETMAGATNKIVQSADGHYILFNTNLPDTFGKDILIMAEVRKKVNGEEYFENPSMFTKGVSEMRRLGFSVENTPQPASFFEDVNEVIFQSSWTIDSSFEHLDHIIQDNRSRFPKEYQEKDPVRVAGDLEQGINMAVRMAKRNFKYIAPMYRPQKDCIQMLMPIYLSGSYRDAPDFALVLTPDNGIYIPETILPIDGAYQNARLIAMPDEAWLRPDTIFSRASE